MSRHKEVDRVVFRHPRPRPWESGEWWDEQARAVGGPCGKCGGVLRGVVVDDVTERGVVAVCANCGAERVVVLWDSWARGNPHIPLDRSSQSVRGYHYE
jgi:hypothetical protein